MTGAPRSSASERWFRLLLRFYPADFREEMGDALVETYQDRARSAASRGGALAAALVWLSALADSLRNGLGERLRPAVTWPRAGNWGRDGELAVRRLVRAPLFAASMIGTLTVGLGAFTVVYAVVDKVMLEPLPYERPDDLYFVWRNYTWIPLERGWLGGTDVAAMQTAGGVIEGAVALRRGRMTLGGSSGVEPDEVSVIGTSAGLFELLGVAPALGRVFAPNEEGPGRPPLVVLSDDLWRRQFGADRTLVGSEIRLDGSPFTVIGIMPPDFRFVRHASMGSPEGADVYITLEDDLPRTNPFEGSYAGLIRARPGTPAERVAAEVDAVGRMIDERDLGSRGLRLFPVGVKADLVAPVRPALTVLGLAGVFLLLVLLANLAALLLARAGQREREFGIARALGANPIALARATLFEGGLLGFLGGLCGALLAVWGTRALVALAPLNLPRRDAIAVDWEIAATVILIGTMLGLLAAAAPAAWGTRTDLSAVLRNAAARGSTGGNGRLRRGMVVAQVALSLVLLSSGALVARSFDRLLRADPGFDAERVLTMRIPVSRDVYPTDVAVRSLHERLHRELASLPGVVASGAASAVPLTAGADQASVYFPGAPGNTGVTEQDEPLIDYFTALPGYFEALGIDVLAGRGFQPANAGAREVVIDRTLAAHFFPSGNPIGATMRFNDDTLTVIGVVEHARTYDVYEDGRSQIYLRNDYRTEDALFFAIRSDRDPLSLVPEARAAIRRVDPQLPVVDVRSMDQVVSESLRQQRVSAVLIGGFSLGALLLAAMGLFGVVAAAVNRRRHELAIRLALGAHHGRVLRLLLGESARLILLGMVIGVPGVYFAGQALRGMLIGVSPFDPPTLAATAAGLAIVAVLACYIPARRIATIDPARALGEE